MIRSQVTIKKGDFSLIRFDGLSDVARYIEAAPDRQVDHGKGFAGATIPEALDRAINGNPALVPASDKLLARLEAINPPTSAWETQGAVAGGVANVPAYLAGQPVNMRLRRRVENQGAPLAILIDLTVSAGVDHQTILRRGAATFALVRAAAAKRPVTLLVCCALRMGDDDICATIPIDTAPLDLARAAWALGAPEMLRAVLFNVCHVATGSKTKWIPWMFGDHRFVQEKLPEVLAPHIGLSECIATPGVALGATFGTDEQAAQWVETTLAKL